MGKAVGPKPRLHIHFQKLLGMELVILDSGHKNTLQHYKLLYNGEGQDGRTFLLGLLP